MWSKFLIVAFVVKAAKAQVDNFACPDEFEGYYPHLYSCDKYWKCIEGIASLETCGNGLAFDDLDPTYTTENCDYIYNVECGNRTDLEPPISAPNCPRLYGTFPDPEDCTAFFNCRNGLSNRYNCAPGLAFDPKDRVCKWADQVKACEKMMNEEEKSSMFTCPSSVRGIYTKHAHPEDCRQYYVCISGTAREYGCPLGSVFKITQPDQDGICADATEVPECANYYGDLEFQPEELVKAGVDPEAVGIRAQASPARTSNRVSNTFTELQIPDEDLRDLLPERVLPDNRATPPRFRNRPQIQSITEAPRPTTTTTTTTEAPEVVASDDPDRPQPAVVKAGEDYYYYYYYYDDDEDVPEDV